MSSTTKPRTLRPKPTPEQLRADTTRAVTVVPETFNADDNTIEVVFGTGQRVLKFDWTTGNPYWEDLPLSGMDLTRVNKGCHVLRDHNAYSVANVFASSVPGSARVEANEAKARIKLSDQPSNAELVGDVKAGIIREWSFGYRKVGKPVLSVDPETGYEIRTWTRHIVNEISAVGVAADSGTYTRSDEDLPADPAATEEDPMSTKHEPEPTRQDPPAPVAAPAAAPVAAAPVVDLEAIRREAREEGARAEATRRTGVLGMAKRAKLAESHDEVRACLADPSITPEAAGLRFLGLAAAADGKPENETHPQHGAGIAPNGPTAHDKRMEAMTLALAFRANPVGPRPDGIGDFVGCRLADFAYAILEQDGQRMHGRISPAQAVDLALGLVDGASMGVRVASTSDYPLLLSGAVNLNFRRGYAAETRNFEEISERRVLPDFKTATEVGLGSVNTLDETPEGAEIKFTTISENGETWIIASFTKGLAITRKALINDSLNAFGSLPVRAGGAVIRTELAQFWKIFRLNANMRDGNKLFSAAHANVTASGASTPSVTEIDKGRKILREQTDPDGSPLNLVPTHIIVPPSCETAVDQLLAQITPNQASGVTPAIIRNLKPIIEPRLGSNATAAETALGSDHLATMWFLAAAGWLSLVHGYLEGYEQPRLRSWQSQKIQGVEMVLEHDFGCGDTDHRGLWRTKGAA